ncbi:cullin-4A-like, partial [Diorhabda sublineata]|uniref:cullin-4A-like n=1 Tax=Diorhabda sublineata TaxID=1163346 RepID=UPI0024E188D8
MFQNEFLKNTKIFYLDEGSVLINAIDIRAYLRHCQARIKEELIRGQLYLKKSTSNAVLELLTENLIKERLPEILAKIFILLDKGVVDKIDLKILYDLVRKVNVGLNNLIVHFIEFIMKRGNFIVSKPENDKYMIQELLDLKDELDDIVEHGFQANDIFNDIIRNCFVKFMNSKQNKLSQLLAKYVDLKLKSRDISEEQLDNVFDKVMVLFRYIQGKDIFEAFYKKDLAKRLLLGKSTSQDAEDSMIGKLKAECGTGFTSKIEGMFQDINISQSMNSAFKQHLCHTCSPISSDLCINVLTSSFWPNYPTFKVNLPAELINFQDTFQKFYSINHSGRKLFWQPNLGHCIVKAYFENGKKELQVSLLQTIVLLLFNDSQKLTFREIYEITNIEMEELKRILISLVYVKNRVLLKQSKTKDIEPEDTFCINTKFTDKLFRVKINQIQLKETVEEQQATEKSVLVDRQFQIDAAIVRILKNKKKIGHNELISELFNNLDIPVKPYDLKKRIELLIEREYMDRDNQYSIYR